MSDIIPMVDIVVIQEPKWVEFECPHCKSDIDITYKRFCDLAGEPCDWRYTKISCPECDKSVEIRQADWE